MILLHSANVSLFNKKFPFLTLEVWHDFCEPVTVDHEVRIHLHNPCMDGWGRRSHLNFKQLLYSLKSHEVTINL
jgi:hypothetical protein